MEGSRQQYLAYIIGRFDKSNGRFSPARDKVLGRMGQGFFSKRLTDHRKGVRGARWMVVIVVDEEFAGITD